MRDEEKKQIQLLRQHGMTYKQIVDYTGATIDTVRYHCKGITPDSTVTDLPEQITKHRGLPEVFAGAEGQGHSHLL